jgi:multisubunit Na+/H+ antiporter MnhB subunit
MKQNILEMSLTYGGLVLGVALVAIMIWLEKRPRKSIGPRMVPTTPLMFLGVFICLIAVVHIVNHFGIHTGRR